MRVTFDVTPPVEGVVYQNAHMTYYVGNDERTFEYSEAWRMSKTGKSGKRKRTPTLDQGGDDSFLVPDGAWADDLGTLTITTAAWFEEGKIDPSFSSRGRARSYGGGCTARTTRERSRGRRNRCVGY
jgi:hypothetical protein